MFSVGRVVGELVLTDNWSKTLTTAAQTTAATIPKLDGLAATAAKTAVELDKLEKEAKQYNDAMTSFGGGDMLGKANAAVKAVNDLGGATKLTTAEQKQLNATVNEAISKYNALGAKAPADMQKLADATKKAASAGKSSGAGGIFGSMFAQFTLAGLATQAISAVTAELSRFMDIAGKMPAVENSFNKLTSGIGQNAEKMKASMRDGTKGMVSDFDLMTQANKAMLLGLPITADGMGNLAKTATTLGKAMGQDAGKSLDDLITALGRSSPKILDNLGLTVDITAANETYADSLHKTVDQLTDSEKQMAFYNAAMVAAEKKTKQIGEQTETLGEIMSRVWTKVENAGVQSFQIINEEAGKTISNMTQNWKKYSLLVAKDWFKWNNGTFAVGAIFNANAQMDIDRQAKTQAALDAEHKGKTYGPYVAPKEKAPPDYTKQLKDATDAYNKLDSAKKLNIQSAIEMNKTDEETLKKLGITEAVMGAAKKAYDAHKTSVNASEDATKKLADAQKAITAAAKPLTDAQKAVALANEANNASATDTATVLGISAQAVQNYLQEVKNAEQVATTWEKAHEKIAESSTKALNAASKAYIDSEKKIADASGKALAEQLAIGNDYYDKNAQNRMDATDRAIFSINKERDAAVAGLDKQFKARGPLYDRAVGEIDEFYQHELDLANETNSTLVERLDKRGIKTQEAMATMAQKAATEYYNMEKSGKYTSDQLREAWLRMTELNNKASGDMAAKTIAAFNSISQSFSQLASSIGGKIGGIFSSLSSLTSNLAMAKEEAGKWDGADVGIASSLFDKNASSAQKWATGVQSATAIAGGAMDVWRKTTEAANSSQAAFAGAMSGASAGAAFGPWGAAIGAAAGALTGFIRGLTAGRRAIEDFADSMGGFDEFHDKLLALGDAGEQMWIKMTQKTDKGDKNAAMKVIAEAEALLASSPAAMAAAAGYKTREELQKTADEAKRVYEFMAASGQYSAEVLTAAFEAMGDAQADVLGDAAEKQQEAMDKITASYKDQFDKLNTEYESLYKSVSAEAEEAEMGITETKERERMKQIDAERAALQAKQDAEIKAHEEANAGVVASAEATKIELDAIYGEPIRIPYYFDPMNSPQGVPNVSASSTNAGPVPGSGRPTTINMYQDGKKTASVLLPHLAEQYEVHVG